MAPSWQYGAACRLEPRLSIGMSQAVGCGCWGWNTRGWELIVTLSPSPSFLFQTNIRGWDGWSCRSSLRTHSHHRAPPDLPEMKLVLVLALALLGAVSAHQLPSDKGTPEQEVPAKQGEEEPAEPEPPCPMESESFRMIVPGQGGHTCRYVFVNNCQPFWTAQKLCARCYHGHLASIHNYATNQRLSCMAHARTNQGQVWIGGYTSRWFLHVHPRWVDHSSWNYSNWARGNPWQFWKSCVAMCTVGEEPPGAGQGGDGDLFTACGNKSP
ncbi:bone marrow proteoglycan-like isoform X1 [Gopherus evgoodei]|uniref:bone marrow proteoglycan-like isoform X1 n=1 Tax=Gopherus evgoodei TaxID=1825980 RepID=UPI0011D0240E|nr:bone marrow proteoglycan-like isoform X1 [Gopherus evgoodei]